MSIPAGAVLYLTTPTICIKPGRVIKDHTATVLYDLYQNNVLIPKGTVIQGDWVAANAVQFQVHTIFLDHVPRRISGLSVPLATTSLFSAKEIGDPDYFYLLSGRSTITRRTVKIGFRVRVLEDQLPDRPYLLAGGREISVSLTMPFAK